jgi:hypothetical protein
VDAFYSVEPVNVHTPWPDFRGKQVHQSCPHTPDSSAEGEKFFEC